MICSPMPTKSKIFPSGSSSPLFQSVGCEQGGWNQGLGKQHGHVQKFHLRCSQLEWCVFLCVCRPWLPFNCLFVAFFHSSEKNQECCVKSSIPSHLYRLVTPSGWVLFVSALHGGKHALFLADVILLCSPALCRNKKIFIFIACNVMKCLKKSMN